jgi:elongation factor Ts
MTIISAELVKELREKTSVGMMDCKKALTETKGDMEAAIDWLRKKGLSKASAKAGRVAAEGLVGIAAHGTEGSIVEVNSETDFVARNAQFQAAVRTVAALAGKANGDVAILAAMPFEAGKPETVDVHIKELIATIGENMSLRRIATLRVPHGAVSSYIHNAVVPGLGKIGVLVALESTGKDTAALAELGRLVAMQVAATNPVALDLDSVPTAVLDREKAILADKNQGKPPQVLEKILASAMKSYAKDNCLIDQIYIHDNGKTVSQALKDAEGKVGGPIKLNAYVRFALGEGIEKKVEDFAAEVAAAGGTTG